MHRVLLVFGLIVVLPDGAADCVVNITKALAAIQRAIISARSPYDRYRNGDPNAISEPARRGEVVFCWGGKAGCLQRHGGLNFSGPLRWEDNQQPEAEFHDTGLCNLNGDGSYPAPNVGVATLEEVIEH